MKTKMLLNNIVMVCAFLLLAVGAAQPINAAAPTTKKELVYANSTQSIKVGDSIYVNKDSLHYLTGERISTWVYKVKHPVLQVGGKRYPYGILIGGIYSWVYPGCISPVHPMEEQKEEVEEIQIAEEPTVQDTVPTPVEITPEPEEPVQVEETPAPEQLIEEEPTIVEEELVEEFVIEEESESDTTSTSITNVYISKSRGGKGSYDIPVPYEMSRWAIGVRGGFASIMTGIDNFPVGYDALLDLRYAYYWAADKSKPALGIMTGLSAGYVHSIQTAGLHKEFTLNTDEGDVDYVITADNVTERTHQMQLEIPIMFSMVTEPGFFLNVGPKIILPVYSTFNQQIVNPVIEAYVPELNGKPITNNVVMGVLSEEQCNITGRLNNQFKLSLALSFELGYSFKLKHDKSRTLDLGIYADYAVYSMFKLQGNEGHIFAITPPSATSAAVVEVQSLTNTYAGNLGFFDAGLKITYNFNTMK